MCNSSATASTASKPVTDPLALPLRGPGYPLQPPASVSASIPNANTGWHPIETAPKDGSYILVTNPAADGSWIAHWAPVAASGYRFDQPWRSRMLNHDHIAVPGRYLPPTLWMPLPAPPAGEQS